MECLFGGAFEFYTLLWFPSKKRMGSLFICFSFSIWQLVSPPLTMRQQLQSSCCFCHNVHFLDPGFHPVSDSCSSISFQVHCVYWLLTSLMSWYTYFSSDFGRTRTLSLAYWIFFVFYFGSYSGPRKAMVNPIPRVILPHKKGKYPRKPD